MFSLTHDNDEAGAGRVVSQIVESGGRALAFQSAMAEEADFGEAIRFAQTNFSHVDLFFNNARTYPEGPEGKKTEQEYLQAFRLMERSFTKGLAGLV